jgi:S1-C subfamily serine protease
MTNPREGFDASGDQSEPTPPAAGGAPSPEAAHDAAAATPHGAGSGAPGGADITQPYETDSTQRLDSGVPRPYGAEHEGTGGAYPYGPDPAAGQYGGWQPGWTPHPGAAQPGATPPGAPPPGWVPPTGGGWGSGWTPPPNKRHRALPAALTAALVVAGAAAGVGIGHGLWHSGSSTNAAAGPSSSQGNSNGGGEFDGPPFGNGNGNGNGEFPGGNGGGDGNGGNGFPDNGGNSGNNTPSEGAGGPSDVSSIAAKVNPALADINVTFGFQNAQGAGTGIVLTSNGEILTNNHVIDGATSISVTDVGNGQTYSAKVVGYDSTHDLAVLQLKNASGLKTAQLGDSSKLSVGQSVVAIGNAGGTGGTPTSAGGSITALNQSITASDELDGNSEQLSGLIEVNADVQSGDSGGSLVNSSGKVIGVDTAASDQFSFQSSGGQGYAIPINQALSVAKKIENGHGTSTIHIGQTAFLGVTTTSSDNSGQNGGLGQGNGGFGNEFPNQNGGSGSNVSGATVEGVVNGGAAAKAGLVQGDVITSFGGHAVSSPTDLSKQLVGHHPGDKMKISWVDTNGQSHTATVELGSGPPA